MHGQYILVAQFFSCSNRLIVLLAAAFMDVKRFWGDNHVDRSSGPSSLSGGLITSSDVDFSSRCPEVGYVLL
jgi:hypothetical protein